MKKAKIVGFITILLILSFLIFITIKIMNKTKEKQTDYLKYKEETIKMTLNGDYLEYLPLNEKYKEEGVNASYNKTDLSDKIIISYYKNKEQVSYIDTSMIGSYLVKYTALTNNASKSIYKTVIVTKKI